MGTSKIDIDEVIYKLLQGLRQKGFSIGTDAYIKTTELFHWFLKEKKGNSFTDFGPYLAPLICKSDEEQTNFKQIFNELFTNEFTAFEKRFFSEINLKEEIQKEKKSKILKYAGLVVLCSAVILSIYKIWQVKNLDPVIYYKNLVKQPIYVNKNDTVSLSENAVFKNMRDSSKFNVEYDIRSSKQKRKGFSAKHHFEEYGKDTILVKIKSIRPGIDSTIEFSEIYVGPEKPTITAEKDDIETGDQNIFTVKIDTSINADFYWEISKISDNNDTVNPIHLNSKTIRHTFKEEGDYLVSVKYDKSKTAFLKNFPVEKLSTNFYQKVKTPGLQLEANYTAPLQTTNTNVNKWWLIGLSLLSLIFFYITYRIFKKNTEKISNRKNPNMDVFSGDKPPYDLRFSDRNKNIHYTYDLLRLSNHLKKRIDSPDFFLDISKTIKQSIANRGFPTPRFSQKQQTRQCLFLIDQAYRNSQQVKLFSYLAMYLIQHQVKLDFYFYYQTPDKFYTDEDGARTTLQTLKDRYYNCTLIFFTDGTNFPEYNAPVLKETITIGFAYWQKRLLVTPVNYNDWGRNEKMLSTFFNVIPADVVGLLELIRAMDTDSNDTTLLHGQFYTYESKHVDFNTVKGLQEYLKDDELFQWLCALAIHPKIYWEVILEIGKVIVANPAKINYETLLKLARIQWVHEGNFPTTTRLELLKVLTSENEIKARDAFLKMLDESPMGDDQFSYEEKQISRYANSFVLYASGIPKYTEDKTIQEGEEKFISLYKNKNLSDNAFKIYIEKKETEQGNWNTPIKNENENIGIEKYIHNKEDERQSNIRNERLKRNKKLARYATCAVLSLLLLFYIFFNKNNIAKSRVNEYLKLADTTMQTENSINVKLDTRNCFYKLMQSSKDNAANLEIMNETSVLLSRKITLIDSFFVTSILKNISNDSSKNIKYRITINEEIFIKEMPLVAGSYNISLTGCEKNDLNIYYNAGFKEDTTPVFNAFKGTDYFIKVITTSEYDKPKANMVTFDSAIGRTDMFTYGDNLIKAGFPLKNVTIKNGENKAKNITIIGEKDLNTLPNYTTEKLSELLLPNTISKEVKTNKSIIKIIYGGDEAISKIMQMKSCLKNNFNVTTSQIVDHRTIVNQIKYFNENFKDSIKNLLTCLKTYFPDKTFEVSKSISTKNNTGVAEIYLFDEVKHMQSVTIALSDDILIPQANKFKNDLIKVGYKSSALTSDPNIKVSVIEYHSQDQLYASNEIKRIYSNYFRTSQISLQYSPDPKKRYINLRIKKLNESVKERFSIADVKFPKTINIKNTLPIAFIAGFEKLSSSSNVVYNGKICLEELKRSELKAKSTCENFSFSKERKVIVSKEINLATLSSGGYAVKIKIDQLKMDTTIGYVTITEDVAQNNYIPTLKPACDTVYTYIGNGKYDILFKGKTYTNSVFKKLGISLSLLERDPKNTSFSIVKDNCPSEKISFYLGESKTITFCEGTKISLKMLDWQNRVQYQKNKEAIFDVVICKPTKSVKKN